MRGAPDIERLIASAYSGLEPPAAVEEAVRAGLSAERAKPPRRGPAGLFPFGAAVLAVVAIEIPVKDLLVKILRALA